MPIFSFQSSFSALSRVMLLVSGVYIVLACWFVCLVVKHVQITCLFLFSVIFVCPLF
ncbi:hypothetical protein C2G38_1213460 [Gigaspora rosea]|uniref:Uncharacterized protein n=1 Tax=Gigaspora rosea TaxID=44941 RepID=A0A397W5C6_9GLOM|nr:hypothetical protein C2G38_1213460 [Gigaspora rosea]